MSVMLEVLYAAPANVRFDSDIAAIVAKHSGGVTCKEEPADNDVSQAITLTIEFDDWEDATEAAVQLRLARYHVEGPMTYRDD